MEREALGLAIDPASSTPPFEQLRVSIIDAVRAGTLAPDTRLPPVRTLAEMLGLAPGTIARAYRQLEMDGVIETRGRAGSFIAATGDVTHQHAQHAASEYVRRTAELGITPAEALALVTAALAAPTSPPPTPAPRTPTPAPGTPTP